MFHLSFFLYYFIFSQEIKILGESPCLPNGIYKLFPPHYIGDLVVISYTFSTSVPDFSEKRCCKTLEKSVVLTALNVIFCIYHVLYVAVPSTHIILYCILYNI